MKRLLQVLFSQTGRITRGQFWLAWVLIFMLGFFLDDAKAQLGNIIGIVIFVYLTIAVYGKRLHDFGKSAKIVFIPLLIMAGCSALQFYLVSKAMRFEIDPFAVQRPLVIASAVSIGVWLLATIIIGSVKGAEGDNLYGPNPKDLKPIEEKPGEE